jgi:hypothetical protein
MMVFWNVSRSEVLERRLSCTNYIRPEDLEYYRFKGTAGLFCPDGTNKYAAFIFIDGPACPNGHGSVVDLLIDGLHGTNHLSKKDLVQMLSSHSWGFCASKKLVECFLSALRDDDQTVRAAAAIALQRVWRENFGTNYSAWKEWWSTEAANHL